MTRLRLSIAIVLTAALQACMEVPPPASVTPVSASATATDSQSFLFSWGMFADPVFDRDVETFARSYTTAFGAPAQSRLFGFVSSRLTDPSGAAIDSALRDLATQARDGEDTVVVMLTSHGSPELLALKTEPNGPSGALSADAVVQMLAPPSGGPSDPDHPSLLFWIFDR